MLTPCEVSVKCVLPVVRAMVAKELVTRHRLRQLEAAGLLGVSQSSVSLYSRKIRGRALDLKEEKDILATINNLAASLAKGGMPYEVFIVRLCEVCRVIRSKGLMCKLHRNFDPNVDIEECEICSVSDCF